jgi:hypothetical protein
VQTDGACIDHVDEYVGTYAEFFVSEVFWQMTPMALAIPTCLKNVTYIQSF